MRMRVLAAGTRMPAWVDAGFEDYAGRLRGDYRLELIEIPLGERGGSGDSRRAIETEGKRMLAMAGERAHIVALQVGGKALSTAELARWLEGRAQDGEALVFCIGGPDGLAPEVDTRARLRWSLSALTLPHGLARVVVAEALYRAVSLIKGLPYHRA
jgi:23S rRNA (pseudouridine1915-N3)-methyltransferase